MQMNNFLGNHLGSYRLVREIARGGFGTVYQAQHTILTDRLVAIKVLHDLLLNSSQERDAFLQEAQFLESLKHPFILPLLDVGIQQNIPFLVTEYAASGSLRMRLQAQSPKLLTFDEILTILSQIGQALQYAHQHNIIHRDLKPDNILLNLHGEALLADFGIATLLSTASIGHTSTTGTPAYMAPEQFRGEVSRETDQYSLGCIAYELFTGRKPFTAPDFVALGFKHATENPVPPRQHNPSISTSVEQAILKSMAKGRNQRYPDVMAFVTALQTQSLTASVSKRKVSKTLQSQRHLQTPSLSATVPRPSLKNPTKVERTFAAISYLSPVFLLGVGVGYLIGFFIIYLVGQKSHFIRFHLIQAFLFFLANTAITSITALLVYATIDRGGFGPLPTVLIIGAIFYASISLTLIILALVGRYTRIPVISIPADKFADRIDKGN